MPVQIGVKSSHFSDPTGLMSDCHRRIEIFLIVLRTAAERDGRELANDERRSLDGALRYFREAAPKHNADEEESLFPRLRSITDPEIQAALKHLDRLEQEHRWAAPLHEQVDRLGQSWLTRGALSTTELQAFRISLHELGTMYSKHIQFEDTVLFPLAARLLSPSQKAEIAEEMARRRNLNGSLIAIPDES